MCRPVSYQSPSSSFQAATCGVVVVGGGGWWWQEWGEGCGAVVGFRESACALRGCTWLQRCGDASWLRCAEQLAWVSQMGGCVLRFCCMCAVWRRWLAAVAAADASTLMQAC
jgi:hypothetical protein